MVSVLTSKIDLDDVFVVEIDLVSVWRMGVDSVSYTHLTLPTILRV